MGYQGVKLANLFPRTSEERARRAAREMAEDGADFLVLRARAHTPVNTGHLKESWHRTSVTARPGSTGGTLYRAEAATDVDYAPYVEYGTGLWGPKHAKYPIRPKKEGGVLHFYWGKVGHEVWLKMVMHPGSKEHPMIRAAIMDAIASWHSYLDPALERFMLDMRVVWEREAARGRAEIAGRAA